MELITATEMRAKLYRELAEKLVEHAKLLNRLADELPKSETKVGYVPEQLQPEIQSIMTDMVYSTRQKVDSDLSPSVEFFHQNISAETVEFLTKYGYYGPLYMTPGSKANIIMGLVPPTDLD